MKSWTILDELEEMLKKDIERIKQEKEFEDMLNDMMDGPEDRTVSEMIKEELERQSRKIEVEIAGVAKDCAVLEIKETMSEIHDDLCNARLGGGLFFEVVDLYYQCAETLAEISNMSAEEFLDYEVERDSFLEFILE